MADATSKSAEGTARTLNPEDLDRVVEIDRSVTKQSRRGFFEKRIEARRREPDAFISLAYVEKGVVEGFALAHILDGEFGGRFPVAVLDAIGTSVASRGHGGGKALMAELEKIARGRGAKELRTQSSWSDRQLTQFFAAAGLGLAHRLVMERPCGKLPNELTIGETIQDDTQDMSRDVVPVRSMTLDDLPVVTGLDRRVTGRDRSGYYKRKVQEALQESGIRLSMIATVDKVPAGFIMARVDYGEFGETEPEAVIDTIGVNPDFAGKRVGTALISQLLGNLQGLRVERVRTEVDWDNFGLLAFLKGLGFHPSQRVDFVRAL
jgi:ribosomal protein S18 acetylase RimI-like enzyme